MPKHYIKIKLEIFLTFQQQIEPHPEETLADLYDKSTIKKEKIVNSALVHTHTRTHSHTHTHTHTHSLCFLCLLNDSNFQKEMK